MEKFIESIKNKSVHIVGVTGAEGSSILRFLVKHKIGNITAHDYSPAEDLEKSFRLWHKGLETSGRENAYRQFQDDLSGTTRKFGKDYLSEIEKADIIFVPQSWRLYKAQNAKLFGVAGKIPFYSLMRLYLDFAPAQIIGVTGTVGKGSTASVIYQLLKNNPAPDRKVYLAGNDTWMPQLADKLDAMTSYDILVLEISHRQLLDGFSRAPHVTVITNLYPNHLDEVNWKTYKQLKLSLVAKQTQNDFAVLNYDVPELRLEKQIKSKVIYFGQEYKSMNTKSIQSIYPKLLNIKIDHYLSNILAGLTATELMGIDPLRIWNGLPGLTKLSARLELISSVNGIEIYDDIKSTTPWATLAALEKLGNSTILICGGKTKGIDYGVFAKKVAGILKYIICLKSELSETLEKFMPAESLIITDDLDQSLKLAYQKAEKGNNILISPAAGFFYSDFVRGKKSLRRLVISLLPEAQV